MRGGRALNGAYGLALGSAAVAFTVAAAVLAVAFPYSEWDSFSFGDWSRRIAQHGSVDPLTAGPLGAARPVFYELQGGLWAITGVSFTAGRLLSLAFALLLLVAVWLLAGGRRNGVASALAVLVVVSIPALTDEALMGQTDVPAAAMVGLTAVLALRAPPGRWAGAALVLTAFLSVLTKPTTLVALTPFALLVVARAGARAGLRERLRNASGQLLLGLACGVVYDFVMASRFHQGLVAFLRSGTSDGIWGLRAASERWHALLDLGVLGPALRLPLACSLVYAVLAVAGLQHRRAAVASLVAGSLWAFGGPALAGAGSEQGSFSSVEAGFATIGFAVVLAAAATAADDDAPPRHLMATSLALTAPPILVWAYGTPYSDRLASAAWPGAALLLAATLSVGVYRLAAPSLAFALATVPVALASAWTGLAGINGFHGSQWAYVRQLGWSGLGDRQRTMNIVLPGVQEVLAIATPALGDGRLAVEDPRFSWFLPGRVDMLTPLHCEDVAHARVFVLTTSDENEFTARAAGGLATPEEWQACARPKLRLLSNGDNGYAVFQVESA